MTTQAMFVPDMMEETKKRALMGALERLLDSDAIQSAWPAAHDRKKAGNAIPLAEVQVVVLPLDRIGAPAGASGAFVYIAYYSHAPTSNPKQLASPPLVVKIGKAEKLRSEKEGADGWPTLNKQDEERFARPIFLDQMDADWAVLVAPFHSAFKISDQGTRNTVEVRDLWGLLENKRELQGVDATHWETIKRCIAEALDAIEMPHHGSYAEHQRQVQSYGEAYNWYLRDTTGARRFIPEQIFGLEPTLKAFGETWQNPVLLVRKLISGQEFKGRVGAIHGDLHPKNIVLNQANSARIIDFGWAKSDAHIVQDYLLLDLNLRGITLPSQLSEPDVLALARFLRPTQDIAMLPETVRQRARIIKEVVWQKAQTRAVDNWEQEYLIPFLLVAYGLLVYLDSARNQLALVATVLAAAHEVWLHENAGGA